MFWGCGSSFSHTINYTQEWQLLSSRMTQSVALRGHQILSHFVHSLLLAALLSVPPPAPGSRWNFLSIRPPSRKRLTLRQPQTDSQELQWKSTAGTDKLSDTTATSDWRAIKIACALSHPTHSWAFLKNERCWPQVQMLEMGLISLETYLDKNHMFVLPRHRLCQDRPCSRLRASCPLCFTVFFDASPYRIFLV